MRQLRIHYSCHQRPRGNSIKGKMSGEIMVKMVSNLAKAIKLKIQEAQRTPSRINPSIITKLLDNKYRGKILKAFTRKMAYHSEGEQWFK